MTYDRNLIVAFSFVLLSFGSAIYLSFATLNYLRFYPALNEMRVEQSFQVGKIIFVQAAESNQSVLEVQVSVGNPTDYSGLRLGQVSVVISFYPRTSNSTALFAAPGSLSGSQPFRDQLGPRSVDSVSLLVRLDPEQTNQLVSFNSMYQGQVMARVNLRVDIVTFLEAPTGTVVFTRTQQIPLSYS